MTVNKRKKNSRQRGSFTHGWGSKKKHRGSGNKGGVGRAGSGKRSDCKKPSNWKDPYYFGKFGFKKKGAVEKIVYVNLEYFEKNCDKLVESKLIESKGGAYLVDVEKLGFNKVLGGGRLTKKMKISSPYFSAGAVEKIRAAGGEAVATRAKKEAKEAPKTAAKEAPKKAK